MMHEDAPGLQDSHQGILIEPREALLFWRFNDIKRVVSSQGVHVMSPARLVTPLWLFATISDSAGHYRDESASLICWLLSATPDTDIIHLSSLWWTGHPAC